MRRGLSLSSGADVGHTVGLLQRPCDSPTPRFPFSFPNWNPRGLSAPNPQPLALCGMIERRTDLPLDEAEEEVLAHGDARLGRPVPIVVPVEGQGWVLGSGSGSRLGVRVRVRVGVRVRFGCWGQGQGQGQDWVLGLGLEGGWGSVRRPTTNCGKGGLKVGLGLRLGSWGWGWGWGWDLSPCDLEVVEA